MKRKMMLGMLVVAAALVGSVMPTVAKEVTLRAVSFIRADDTWGKLFADFIKRVNEAGKGLVQINLIGGPEVINQFELGNAIKSGVVDIGMLPGGFYQNIFPASQALSISTISPVEQRKNGAWQELNRLHNEQVNAQLLANYGYGVKFHIYSSKPVNSIDLRGVKLRLVPIYRPFFDALGATTLQTQHSELYTALERQVVDGYGWTLWGLKEQGFLPVTKYRLEPGFYAGNVSILVNLTKWKSMNAEQRDFLTKVAVQFEKDFDAFAAKKNEEERAVQQAAGIKVIDLPDEQAKKFLDIARNAGWADVKAKAPGSYEKLRALME